MGSKSQNRRLRLEATWDSLLSTHIFVYGMLHWWAILAVYLWQLLLQYMQIDGLSARLARACVVQSFTMLHKACLPVLNPQMTSEVDI